MIFWALAFQVSIPATPLPPTRNIMGPAATVTQRNQSIDYGNLPIETLIEIVLYETAAAANQDLRDQMEEMRKVAVRKKEARDLLANMAAERARLDSSVRRYLRERSKAGEFPSYEDWLKSQSIAMPKVNIDTSSGQAKLVKPGDVTSAAETPSTDPPAEAPTRTCANRPDEDDCVIRAMRVRLEWLRRRPAR